MRDNICMLLALLAALLLINYCLPEELPCPTRIPTPMFSTDDCDCDGCCCAPLCKCQGLGYDAALAKALDQDKPLVVYLNTRVHPVEGAVVCRVTSFPADFNVGVIVGVPLRWQDPQAEAGGMMRLTSLYGPRSPKHILGFINDFKAKVKARHLFIPNLRGACGPIG